MNEQNFIEETQDSTDDIQHQAYMALVEDFKELIDTTVRAGKDSYKHVDLYTGKSFEESVTNTVPLDDDKARLLAGACADLANSTLWLYYRNNQFRDMEFAEVVNDNYPQMTYVNIYLLVYGAMKSLKDGSLSRIMANMEYDSDRIGNLAFYFFNYILEILERPL